MPVFTCSSYQEEKIDSKANSNLTKGVLFTHLAVIGDYVASCITFTSPNTVPAGNKYHVTYHKYVLSL